MNVETSGNIILREPPKDVQHPQLDIEHILFNKAINRVFIEYSDPDTNVGTFQMQFQVEKVDDEVHITREAVGMVEPERVSADPQTSGEKEAYWTYKILEELGFVVDGFNPQEKTQ
jgi:hypothetical protein